MKSSCIEYLSGRSCLKLPLREISLVASLIEWSDRYLQGKLGAM
ncbi:MAG: hypothetical protein AAF600_11060 [Bacteroidota bacterium]